MEQGDLETIKMRPVAVVRRAADENERDRSLVSEIVFARELAPALDGVEAWSHIYVICWLDRVARAEEPVLHFPRTETASPPVGIFATRAPIHPNPIGLTLV
jgi:tRNA (Thr-GGU) A37 N-methylase